MKISIIIPVYNVEKYLRTCLDSVVSQTWEDVEAIVVNDASPDSSKNIMKEYEQKYPDKIKCVYLEENLCQGGARNKGLELATGDYITYLDSDDFLDVTMCEKMVRKAMETNADMVYCDAYRNFVGTDRKVWVSYQFANEMGDMTDEKRMLHMLNYGFAWAKLIRTRILKEHNILFPEHIKYEDMLFVPLLLPYIQKTAYVQEPLYYYAIREQSVMTTRNTEHHKDMAYVGDLLHTEMKKRNLSAYSDLMKAIAYYKATKLVVDKNDNPDVEFIYDVAQRIEGIYTPDKKLRHIAHDPIELAVVEAAKKSKEELAKKIEEGFFVDSNVDYKPFYQAFSGCIRNILDTYLGKRIAIWGYGKKGSALLEVIHELQVELSYIIDKNEKLHGQVLESGEMIESYDNICDIIDVVMVVNRNYYSSIEREIRGKNENIIICNLEEQFMMDAISTVI